MNDQASKQSSRRGFRFQVHQKDEGSETWSVKELFVGEHTIFSLLGFTVGGILIGRSLYEYSVNFWGLIPTISIGFLLFIISGMLLHRFRK